MGSENKPLSAKEHAQSVRAYVRADLLEGKSQKEAASHWGISQKTVGAWAKEWRIDELRETLAFGPEEFTAQAYRIMSELNDQLLTAVQEKRVQDVSRITDATAKIMKAIEQVSGLTLGQKYGAIKAFVEYLAELDREHASETAEYMVVWLQEEAKNLERRKLQS